MDVKIMVKLRVNTRWGNFASGTVFIPLKNVPYSIIKGTSKYNTEYKLDDDFIYLHVHYFLQDLKPKWWRCWLPKKYHEIYDELGLDYNEQITALLFEIIDLEVRK